MAFEGPHPFPVISGGTGNASATAYGLITGGTTTTGAFQVISPVATGQVLISGGAAALPSFSATPTVTGMTITGTPSAGTDAANVTYVTNAIAAVNPAVGVVAATTANLNATYLNGVAGVGATLTNAGALVAFTVDGQSPSTTQRILVKNQTSTFQNGVYTVTTVGSGAVAWVLTRALDYDQPSDINNTGVINVLNGTVNAGSGWVINSSVTTVGTDAITYTQFVYPPATFLQVANNLSDVNSASTSRTNLGLTAVATQTVTQHDVLVGGASNAITSVAPSATSGIPLVSNGASSDPSFTTAVVAGGGTGVTSTTAYAVLCGGTTSTGALQSIAGVGTSGQILTSNGAGALPTFQASSAAGTFVLLSSQSASNSASISFSSSIITSTYNIYLIQFRSIVPVTNGSTLQMTLSTNNGSTYLNSGYTSGMTDNAYNASTWGNANNTAFWYAGFSISNSAGAGNNGTFWFYNPLNSLVPSYTSLQMSSNSGNFQQQAMFGTQSTTNVNNIQFAMSSGNISAGIITVYGVIE